MARQKTVIDASVIVKWFLNEPNTENALQFLNSHNSGEITIVIPELLFIEVINVLRYKGKNEKELITAISSLFDTQLHIEHTNQFLIQEATRLALNYDLSLYDATYAALAKLHDCPLLTEDKKLSKLPYAITL